MKGFVVVLIASAAFAGTAHAGAADFTARASSYAARATSGTVEMPVFAGRSVRSDRGRVQTEAPITDFGPRVR
jgi:hypothetical protein